MDGRARLLLESHVVRSRVPGIHYLALDARETRFEYHGGWADLVDRRPMRPDTTMMAYSMSKTLTAAATLLLVAKGRLVLDAPIADVLGADPFGSPITPRQLLAHTSGIANPIPLRWVHAAALHASFDEGAAIRELLRRHRRLASPPGGRFAYSNIGYWLLGRLVERASGERFTAFVESQLLAPLAAPPGSLGYVIPDDARHASGYLERYSLLDLVKGLLVDRALIGPSIGRWVTIESHYVNGAAFGGLVGTVSGFGRFLQDLLAPRSAVFSDAARELFFEPQHTLSGAPIDMTLGWHLGRSPLGEHFFKEGGGGGFRCLMRLYRSRGFASIVMVNATAFDVMKCLDEVDAQLLG